MTFPFSLTSFFHSEKNEKKDERQIEHIIKAEKGIIALIKNSQTHLVVVTANFPGETKNFTTSIIKVDYQNKLFYLDELSPYDGNINLNKLKKVKLKSYLDNCVLSMECPLKKQAEEKGLLYSIMHFPKTIRSIQHREFYRINIPTNLHIKVVLKTVSGELLTGSLNDISYNGMSVGFRVAPNIDIKKDKIIPFVKIHLHQNVIISCKMEIKRIFSIAENRIIAGVLDEVPTAQQQNIQKFITHLDRQKRRNEENQK